jgi:hypothetical protein
MTDPRDPVDPPAGAFAPPSQSSPFPPLAGDGPADPQSDWNTGADAHDLSVGSGRLAALRRFAFPPDEPPGEAELAARDLRWTGRVILTATVVLLVFNAASLQSWARQQPVGWVAGTVRAVGDAWAERVALLGTDQPRRGIREAWEAFRQARFIAPAQGADGRD